MGEMKTSKTYITPLTADCVEFCPVPGLENFLVCGNYQLESPEISKRVGKLSLHDSSGLNLSPISEVDTDAVLDVKFKKSAIEGKAYFCSVESTGYFRLWSLSSSEINNVFSKLVSEHEILLSCDWNEDQCAISTSGGNLCILDVSEVAVKIQEWHCHDHEAWIVAFDGEDKNIVYSGSDDCCLRKHDLRLSLGKGQLIGKRGMMGITSIQSHPILSHIFASGSYDETVSLWDSRSTRTPLEEISVGGGAWRLKWEPNAGNFLLVGAMHNGFQMLSYETESGMKSVGSYMEHESLAYGCDWFRGDVTETESVEIQDSRNKNSFLIATCSMYDCALHTWYWTYDN